VTISQPSREVYVIDIPEVKDFTATFRYNFFVPDESINDTGELPENVLLRNASEIDSEFVQYASQRTPRFVVFNFTPAKLSDVGREVTDVDIRNNVFDKRSQKTNLISDNIDKIVTEDDFTSHDFISVNFHDSALNEKLHYLVSSSYDQFSINDENSGDVSLSKAADRLQSAVPQHIKPHFLTRGMVQLSNSGVEFFSKQSPGDSTKNNNESRHKTTKNTALQASQHDKTRIINNFFTRLHKVNVHVQVNGKLFHDVIDRSIKDPSSMTGDDLHGLHNVTKQVKLSSQQRLSLQVNDSDYKTTVPFVDLKVQRTAHQTDRRGAEIVGFVIDKYEVTKDNGVLQHPPIIIENSRANTAIDFNIRYKSVYAYVIRTIAKFSLPAIDDNTGDIATLQVLVSSRPSQRVYVTTEETVAPPPPSDVNFTWDYEKDKLLVHWSFPPNSQRDIKKFQVFRRKDVTHAFELLKMYDFDDSAVKFDDKEDPDPSLIEFITSPTTFYIDDDFTKSSKFIYSTAAIDAHGMTSNYSAQYEIWFDSFKNKLQKRLVSHSGAPKPYPNLYLETDMFVDTIRVSGPHSKRMKVYFNPERYFLYDDDDRLVNLIATKQTKGEYKLQFTNVDNQKSQTITINIDDQLKQGSARQLRTQQRPGPTKPLK
jgi:hypothetical protein